MMAPLTLRSEAMEKSEFEHKQQECKAFNIGETLIPSRTSLNIIRA